MSRMVRHAGCILLVLTAAMVSGAAAPNARSASSALFSGRATVISGTVAGIPITLVDTGPVAPEGDALEANLLCYPNGPGCTVTSPVGDPTSGALQAEVLHAAVVAGGDRSNAEASVAEVGVAAAGQHVSAEFLRAEAEARCADGHAFVRGGAEILGVAVNGQRIDVGTQVNQRIDLPGGGFVVVNEQVASAEADRGDITVSALHVVIPGVVPGTDTDLTIARAHADVVCASPPPPCNKDFVTGGGWFYRPSDSANKAHFAVAGGVKKGSFWGHLVYKDRAAGLSVRGTGVTAYDGTGTSRHIEGTAAINGAPGSYAIDVADNGEPGRADTFQITLSNGYTAAGTLGGGNIQLHTCK